MLRLLRFSLFFFALATMGTPVTAHAESPPCTCGQDEQCPDEGICDGCDCFPEGSACADSSDCAEGKICDMSWDTCRFSACPGEDCPPRCKVPNGMCRLYDKKSCTADSECGTDELCAVSRTYECAEGDEACAAVPRAQCLTYMRFCWDNLERSTCSAYESCGPDRRCTLDAYPDEVAAITRDPEKSKRLRAILHPDYHAESTAPPASKGCGGCGTAGPSGMGGWTLLLAGILGIRRRDSVPGA